MNWSRTYDPTRPHHGLAVAGSLARRRAGGTGSRFLSRALVEIFESELLAKSLVFRGGTDLHKLFFAPPGRYSEDIDLVQAEPGKIGSVLDELRKRLDPWLGEPGRKRGEGRVTLLYKFETTAQPVRAMRLKLEINTREHFNVLDLASRRFEVESP